MECKQCNGQCHNQSKLHEEFLAESYVMSLMGLDSKDPKDQKHLQDLRNVKKMPYCSLSTRCRVYPRSELERWMWQSLKHGTLNSQPEVLKQGLEVQSGSETF